MTCAADAIRRAEAMYVKGKGSLTLTTPTGESAVVYLDGGFMYSIEVSGFPLPTRKRARWSTDQRLHTDEARKVLSDLPDDQSPVALVHQDIVDEKAVRSFAREHFLLSAEIVLSWGDVETSWARGDARDASHPSSVPLIGTDRLEGILSKRHDSIKSFAQWANISPNDVPEVVVSPPSINGKNIEPQSDAEFVLLHLSPQSLPLGGVSAESGTMGLSMLAPAAQRLYQRDAVSLHLGEYALPYDPSEQATPPQRPQKPNLDPISVPLPPAPAVAVQDDLDDALSLPFDDTIDDFLEVLETRKTSGPSPTPDPAGNVGDHAATTPSASVDNVDLDDLFGDEFAALADDPTPEAAPIASSDTVDAENAPDTPTLDVLEQIDTDDPSMVPESTEDDAGIDTQDEDCEDGDEEDEEDEEDQEDTADVIRALSLAVTKIESSINADQSRLVELHKEVANRRKSKEESEELLVSLNEHLHAVTVLLRTENEELTDREQEIRRISASLRDKRKSLSSIVDA